MRRTLIIFGTRRGTTEYTAQVIAETLILKFRHRVELVNIKRIRRYRKRFNEFDNIIVGTSIVRDRWIRRVLRFLKKHSFSSQRVAIFITAGYTLNKAIKYGLSKKEVREEAIQKYIDPYLPEFTFKPFSKAAFGGMTVKSFKEKFNSWDREEIESWASQLGHSMQPDISEILTFQEQNI